MSWETQEKVLDVKVSKNLTLGCLENIEEIMSIEGVDGIFVANDLENAIKNFKMGFDSVAIKSNTSIRKFNNEKMNL